MLGRLLNVYTNFELYIVSKPYRYARKASKQMYMQCTNVVSKPYRYARKANNTAKLIFTLIKFQNLIGMLGRKWKK